VIFLLVQHRFRTVYSEICSPALLSQKIFCHFFLPRCLPRYPTPPVSHVNARGCRSETEATPGDCQHHHPTSIEVASKLESPPISSMPQPLSRVLIHSVFSKTLWVKGKEGHKDFHWQTGYGCFYVTDPRFRQFPATSGTRRSTTARSRFRTNAVSCCACTGRNGMSGMSGIERGGATPAWTQHLRRWEIRAGLSRGSLRFTPPTPGLHTEPSLGFKRI